MSSRTDVVVYCDVSDVLRRYLDALYLGIGSVDDLLADPVHLISIDESGRESEGSRSDVIAGGQVMRAAFSDAEVAIESQSASGSTVTATVCFRGTHTGPLGGFQPTYKRVEARFTDEVFIEAGRVRSVRSRSHKPGIREQLGVVDQHPVPARVLGPPDLVDEARRFLSRFNLTPHAACRVAPPGAKWSNLKGVAVGMGLGGSGLDFVAGGLATSWIKASAKQRSGLINATDHMALILHEQGILIFETHKRRGSLVKPLINTTYDAIVFVSVIEAMTPLIVITWVHGKQGQWSPARLEGHGPDATSVFRLLESRRSGEPTPREDAAQHVQVTAPGAVNAPGAAAQDPLGSLERLAALHASGALTDEEFEAQKQRILGML